MTRDGLDGAVVAVCVAVPHLTNDVIIYNTVSCKNLRYPP